MSENSCDARVKSQWPTDRPLDKETDPLATMYSAYDVARQLVQIRNYVPVPTDGFAELPKDVLSALLRLTAEWRSVEEIETLIQMGANPHETHEGFTVLEMFIQGHDGYWRGKDSVEKVEVGVKMLAKYGVTCEDLSHRWILSNCEEMISNSEYLSTFFKVESQRVAFYFHAPRANKLIEGKMSFRDIDDAVKTLPCMTDLSQYVAVLEYKGDVTRYLVTKGAGTLAVIPMESKSGWTKEQDQVSNIVNFVMGNDEYPTLVCEDDDE